MPSIHDDVVNVLSRLGVASLTTYVGEEKVNRFNSMGLPVTSEFLSEVLYIEDGLKVFKNQSLRLELLASLGNIKLSKLLDEKKPSIELLKNYNNYSWGDNKRSKEFLSLMALDDSIVSDKQSKTPPEAIIEVPHCLHPYQNWVRKKIIDFLGDNEKHRTLVHMPTGAGKTRTAMESVCDFLRGKKQNSSSVVWLAHSEELCEQAVESFSRSWSKLGTEPVKIVRMWGGNKVDLQSDESVFFLVVSFQTAYNILVGADDERFQQSIVIKEKCGLLVVDEAHQSTAPTYKDVIDVFSSRGTKLIGLTATPGRHHVGADTDPTKELATYYENNKIDIVGDDGQPLSNPIEFLTEKGVLATIERYQLESQVELNLTETEKKHIEKLLDVPNSLLKKLGKDERRTNLIAVQAIKLALENQLPTIIFAPSKDNAIELATLLTIKNCKSAAVTADSSPTERQEAIQGFKEGNIPVLINFGVLTTGFDAPNIQAVIIARPTTSVVLYSQMIGRGLRGPLMAGQPNCILVDVIDNLTNMPNVDQAFTFFDSFYT